jgi:hypothetical protein
MHYPGKFECLPGSIVAGNREVSSQQHSKLGNVPLRLKRVYEITRAFRTVAPDHREGGR